MLRKNDSVRKNCYSTFQPIALPLITILVCLMHLRMAATMHGSDNVCDQHFTHEYLGKEELLKTIPAYWHFTHQSYLIRKNDASRKLSVFLCMNDSVMEKWLKSIPVTDMSETGAVLRNDVNLAGDACILCLRIVLATCLVLIKCLSY